MFDTSWIADLDADGACRAVAGTQADLREAEWRELALAAHWADLHDEQTLRCPLVRCWPVSSGRSGWVGTGRRWWRSSRVRSWRC